ncbi:response regulator transcription factor [Parapedobacter indicus]|uniref:Two component transcriptional regulator, LuxR family n=1 Tax=Parapedobacter indicus TaxID=1477437 RepID=A0A1I3F1W5_9SPHI|nr:response regulator transcription factor [Parapedobacter indicus]PPL03524.1 LuxR family two component transcriptional regulator [Parapedobacter indicus]SFI05224.1 two component transcriptional regulator, LuxR family [Parapedobacter indicus]
MEKKPIKVIIVDDHPVVLQGFEYMLQDVKDILFTGKFADAATALGYLQHNAVDVVLLDINLPDRNGIDVCAAIRQLHADMRIIAISNINEYSIVQRMLTAGANGYFLKNASADEVVGGIRKTMEGEMAFSKGIQDILNGHKTGDLPIVTRREKEVLALLAAGLSSIEIGERIFISPLTVESHRRNLLQKFKVTNVAALIHKATEMKYI